MPARGKATDRADSKPRKAGRIAWKVTRRQPAVFGLILALRLSLILAVVGGIAYAGWRVFGSSPRNEAEHRAEPLVTEDLR